MEKNSIKSFIINYLTLKILTSQYLPNEIIDSEKKLAVKFQCSKLTARYALITLVNLGILDVKKGIGYSVSESAINIIFPVTNLSNQANFINLCEVKENNNGQIQFLNKYYKNNDQQIGSCLWTFEKSYFALIKNIFNLQVNIHDVIINFNSYLLSYKEYFVTQNNKVFLYRKHYDERENFTFQYLLFSHDLKLISYKKFIN